MDDRKNRRVLAAVLAAGMLFVGGCDNEGGVSEDPQGPAEQAPGTEGPQASPNEDE